MKQRLVVRDEFGLPRKISLLILVLIYSLIGCSSGGGGGSSDSGGSQDAVLYQQALSNYQAGDYPQALNEFQSLVTQYPNSIYVDNAQYYTARCYHEQQDFATARSLYDSFVATYSTSNYTDNAVFYHGRSYFDEAAQQTDAQAEFDLLQTAITELLAFISNHSASSLLDNAQYYLGRSYHDQAGLLQDDAALAADTAAQLFSQARIYYDQVIMDTASIYADNSQYYKAQTYHDEGDFNNARAAYQVLIDAGISSWADDAKYQFAKTHYDEGVAQVDPIVAMEKFQTAIDEFDSMIGDQAYQDSNRLDSAYYFKGRGYQRRADLMAADGNLTGAATAYTSARDVFQQLLGKMPASNWADNALYQRGATYYDEAALAEINTDYGVMRTNLSNAIGEFETLLAHSQYQTSNSADNAQYFLGRSYQMILSMPDSERIGVVGGVDFAAVTYDTARDAFTLVIHNFAQSAWVDNAFYEIGNIYYIEAELAIDDLVKEATFNNALASYNNVVANYPDSIRFDNAVFQIAWIYHLGENCLLEQEWFNYHATLTNVSASNASIRDDHLADLALAVPVSHICTTPTLSLTTYNAPPIL
jgi:outer membrane assembly lipoprotein YfiO